MKSSLEPTEDSLSTTSECEKLQIKEKNNFFNHIEKLAVDHDVIVTNTMIKITYKKGLKDQSASDGVVNASGDSSLPEKKNKPMNSDNSFFGKSPKGPVFHSTPKPIEAEKKKKYVNGLNLISKPNILEGKKNSTSHKFQKTVEGEGNSKNVSNSDKRFLKGDGLPKPKPSINRKSGEEDKKKKYVKTKESDKKLKKLENGVKKKTGVDKKEGKVGGVKRKASNAELDVSECKKIKISESKEKELLNGDVEEEIKTDLKKQIMLVDPDLPAGWSRFIRTKNEGSANEQYVVYVVNPQGKKFRYKWKLRQYLLKTNSTLDPDQFFFGLYQRTKNFSNSERLEDESESLKDNEPENEEEKQDESSNDAKNSDGRELLLFDPDLPLGWKRIIHSSATNGKKQVHIVSPDGKIFRRRYLLNDYLIKHQFNHSLDQFYFGLYPKKQKHSSSSEKEAGDQTPDSIKLIKTESPGSAMVLKKNQTTDSECDLKNLKGGSITPTVMSEDPNLPEGWKRIIKVRSFGESAGRMEVVIISPDGRRHGSKKHLQRYLLQKQLDYKIDDFDFTVFGKANQKKRPSQPSKEETEQEPEPEPESDSFSYLSMKKKFTDKPVPELDISSLKDDIITPEGHLINTVTGLMMCSNLSSARNERRQRLPRTEHEKQLKSHFSSEGDVSFDGCEIPTFWIERLVKCRAEFRHLESDAASVIAETTKEFIKTLSLGALANSLEPKAELKYEHVAEVVDRTECLSFLKTLIPKKITFREYVKLNRPKQFLSFT